MTPLWALHYRILLPNQVNKDTFSAERCSHRLTLRMVAVSFRLRRIEMTAKPFMGLLKPRQFRRLCLSVGLSRQRCRAGFRHDDTPGFLRCILSTPRMMKFALADSGFPRQNGCQPCCGCLVVCAQFSRNTSRLEWVCSEPGQRRKQGENSWLRRLPLRALRPHRSRDNLHPAFSRSLCARRDRNSPSLIPSDHDRRPRFRTGSPARA